MVSLGRVLVLGGGMDYIRLFLMLGFTGAKSVEEADVVCFTGGEDVYPGLYGEKALASTNYNIRRDEFEKGIYESCLKLGTPMVGICRGGQFLNVMNGGKLWQHVNHHTGAHMAREVLPKKTNKIAREFMVTSTHHQMMIPDKSGQVLLVAEEATLFQSFGKEVGLDKPKDTDVEVVWYPKTKSLCFQPHPELRHATNACVSYFQELLDLHILPEMSLPAEILKASITK